MTKSKAVERWFVVTFDGDSRLLYATTPEVAIKRYHLECNYIYNTTMVTVGDVDNRTFIDYCVEVENPKIRKIHPKEQF